MTATDQPQFPGSRVRHGTPSGYKLHRKNGETGCDDCDEAMSAYNRARYERPSVAARTAAFGVAKENARARLAQIYPAVYAALYEEEKRKAFQKLTDTTEDHQ